MKSKIVKCIDCGRESPRKELNHMLRCRDCAMKAVRETMEQMIEHSGPYYEKWKQSMRAVGLSRLQAFLED